MTRYDVIIVGGGRAGVEAALTADAAGLAVLLVDEGRAPGGRVDWPGTAPNPASEALARRLRASTVVCCLETRVWTAEPGFRVETIGPQGPASCRAPALIVAAGAIERLVPFPGWTLPGVTGLAAATILVKAHGVLPGRRTVVAGSGPLLPLVAVAILGAGGAVAAVVDTAPARAWVQPALLTRPGLLARGAAWRLSLARSGVPYRAGWTVREATGTDRVAEVRIGPVSNPTVDVTIAADALCIGHGLIPSIELTRLLGATHRYLPDEGWIVDVDAGQRTDVPGLYACGDGARILGADAAAASGRAAGLAAAADLGRAIRRRKGAPRHAGFATAIARLSRPPDALAAQIPGPTIVCRCEGVTRDDIEAADAHSLAELKAATRCGMGPCAGRMCGEAAAMLLAARRGVDRAALPPWTVRPPLRPVPIGLLAGAFDYADLPIPAPSPL